MQRKEKKKTSSWQIPFAMSRRFRYGKSQPLECTDIEPWMFWWWCEQLTKNGRKRMISCLLLLAIISLPQVSPIERRIFNVCGRLGFHHYSTQSVCSRPKTRVWLLANHGYRRSKITLRFLANTHCCKIPIWIFTPKYTEIFSDITKISNQNVWKINNKYF